MAGNANRYSHYPFVINKESETQRVKKFAQDYKVVSATTSMFSFLMIPAL